MAISLIYIFLMDHNCLVSLIDQLLVKTGDYGVWGFGNFWGHIRIADDLADCVVRSDSRILNFSLL